MPHDRSRPSYLTSRPVAVDQLGDRLSGLRLCSPSAVERVRQSLSRHGQLTAVIVFDDGERLQVVDGFKRMRAARRLGWSEMRVSVVDAGETTATAALVTLHQRHPLTELEEGWLVRRLYREHSLTQGVIAKLIGRHKSWVSRRLMLAESLDPVVQADVRLGLLSPRAALSVAALPRGNQHQAAELISNRGMTTRQAERLVRDLRALDSDEARRLAIEQWPKDRLQKADGDPSARPRTQGEQLMADVSKLMRVGVRLEVQLLDCPLAGLGADGSTSATAALRELAGLLRSLARAIAHSIQLQEKADATLEKP